MNAYMMVVMMSTSKGLNFSSFHIVLKIIHRITLMTPESVTNSMEQTPS